MKELKLHDYFQSLANLEIHPYDLSINKEEIFRAIGNGDAMMEDYVSDLVDDLLAKSLTIASPKACCRVLTDPEFNVTNGTLEIENKNFKVGKVVASSLRKSTLLAFFICTAGDGVENFSKKLMDEGNSLEGFIVDIIASVIAEETANYVHNIIERNVNEFNLKVTNRYSPGYCNWPVNDQHILFNLMGNNKAGVKLTTSSLMLPIKSVSGIIGIGENVKRIAYKCHICADEKCILRKII